MSRCRVLQVLRPIAGGMRRHVSSLARGLVEAGYEVIFASPDGPFLTELVREGFEVQQIPLRGQPHPLYDYLCIKKLSQLLKKERICLVHAHGYRAGWVGRIAARLAGAPVVLYTVHSSMLHNPWPRWKARFFLRLDGCLARFTNRIITVSDDLRRELIEQGRVPAELVITIYNGLKFEGGFAAAGADLRAELGLSPETLLVGTVARLAPQKGIPVLIKAAARLAHRRAVRFVVVGDGPLRQELELQARASGAPVVFPGFRDDVPNVLRALDIFVLPSLTEGLPYVILEAMATGLPVVATRVGGIPEVIRDRETGLLVAPGSEEELVLAVEALLDSEDLRKNLGAAAREHVRQHFTEEKMIRETLAVYEKLIRASMGKE